MAVETLGLDRLVEPGHLTIVVGVQSGDEGKGKLAGLLAPVFDTIASGQGGPNAGHSLEIEGIGEVDTHLLTAAVAFMGKLCILGNGKLIDPLKFQSEKADMESKGLSVTPQNVAISSLAHFIKPSDVFRDASREGGKKAQGSTKSGIAFSASDKTLRVGKRVEEVLKDNPENLYQFAFESLREAVKARSWRDRLLHHVSNRRMKAEARTWAEAAAELRPYVVDSVKMVNDILDDGKAVLVEGAQGFWLDPDHGKWPDVTSTNTTTAGILQGLGVRPQLVKHVVGVAKLTKSQVGGQPFITQIFNEELAATVRGERGQPGAEYGTTTGRERAVGYFDLVEIANAIRVDGVTELALTKMDCASRFGESMKVAVAYKHKVTGEEITFAPNTVAELTEYEPVYVTVPTWGDISNIRKYEDLPQEAKDFVRLVEQHLNVPVSIFGVGAKNEEVIVKPPDSLLAA
ncbi:MAG TPA: adenylosuccinate synthetase [Candidatus Saccharimonadales bacterium]|nr:adenylosuccinate synthetase [Candidatus Saccharimonadales bacterium]